VFFVGILTISDRSYRGERIDESGPVAQRFIDALTGFRTSKYEVVPDEVTIISQKIKEWVDDAKLDLIITNGGTGLAPRDVTPEATMTVIERTIPGLTELMRIETKKKAPTSVLSRAVAGSRGKSLIINLPGSPTAVKECLDILMAVVPHALKILAGEVFVGPHGKEVIE
jgi:molybdopterin adenylyltransferase